MKIIYEKTLNEQEKQIVNKLSLECGILHDTARLLFYRGIDTVDKAKRFLNPGKYAFNDPYLLNGMTDAVKRIIKAKDNAENVLVFGDYDADGVCATAILYYCLKEFGIIARTFIPERKDGYGLNLDTIAKCNADKKIDLLITVDCGISDFEKIEELKRQGIDVIVTDHHEPPEILPDCIKINPKIKGQEYPFNGLCGAGVAYKLGYALIGEQANNYLDFASVATVADSMDLVDENRDIVVEGLKIFNSDKIKPAFKYLIGDNGRQITAQQSLAYTIAPRINAGGRMGDANSALQLFLSENDNDVFNLTAKLNSYNLARQVECEDIYRQAKIRINERNLDDNSVILIGDEQWNAGFIGIVAAKLVEYYNKPVIVFAGQDGYFKGSARSIDGVNIYDAICAVKDCLLGFGGHAQAAGLSVAKENFELLYAKLNEYLRDKIQAIDTTPKIYVEWNVEGEFSMRFAKEIERLEPFGIGNKKPLFSTKVNAVNAIPLKKDSPHYSFSTDSLEMLNFNGADDLVSLSLPIDKTIVFEPNVSIFKNRASLKGYVRAVIPEYRDFSSVKLHIFENNIKNLLVDVSGVKIERIENLNFEKGYGKIYVVSDPENIKNHDTLLKLPVYLFSSASKNNADCVIIAPNSLPNGTTNVIYVDIPMQPLEFNGKSVYLSNDCGYKVLDLVSVERSDFTNIFTLLKNNCGKIFNSATEFYYKNINDGNGYNFVFATNVFIELGIFKIRNGVLQYDINVKNPLTNSKLYSKICLLKG
ncbi:MAG: single-stranded-DNA-specific exonuclease RecJ [Clostridia bacterium]|nr:single-stranded-DNA-specific exonuclease RecJ [Clostridia bacterium]